MQNKYFFVNCPHCKYQLFVFKVFFKSIILPKRIKCNSCGRSIVVKFRDPYYFLSLLLFFCVMAMGFGLLEGKEFNPWIFLPMFCFPGVINKIRLYSGEDLEEQSKSWFKLMFKPRSKPKSKLKFLLQCILEAFVAIIPGGIVVYYSESWGISKELVIYLGMGTILLVGFIYLKITG